MFTLTANETTVKAIAHKGGVASAVAINFYAVTGVYDDRVVLNDYEDHNWTYYAGVDNPEDENHYNTHFANRLYKPDPRNVKIIYYGNGKLADLSTDVTGVKVGIDAAANSFTYYKTIEKENNAYSYTTIPNPFSVRPKINTTYYGFTSWRVKSVTGGTITGYAVGATIPAETEIVFVPSGTYTPNCTSMEVELEAVWDEAEVSSSGQFTKGYNSVERNFYRITTSNTTTSFTLSGSPCTYTSIYPNGTTDGTTAATMAGRKTILGDLSLQADSKFEYLYINNDRSMITANTHNLTLGRGISNSNGTGYSSDCVYGFTSNLTSTGTVNYHLRIESGRYKSVTFTSNNPSGTRTIAGILKKKGTLGSDYDRAKGTNNLLNVTDTVYGGERLVFNNQNNKDVLSFDYVVKSGTFLPAITSNVNGEGGTQSVYIGSSQAANSNLRYMGRRRLVMEGGVMAGLTGSMNNNDPQYTGTAHDEVDIRIRGGHILGAVYGAASFAEAVGNRKMVFTGGEINGWVAGGCNGYQTGNGGTLQGDTYIYVGGNAKVVHNPSADYKTGTAYGGNVFGAGSGYSSAFEIGQVNNSNIVVADNAKVSRDVYGGGNYGYVSTNNQSVIYVTGGEVGGSVFGGSNQRYGQDVEIYTYGGDVKGGLYGGSNESGVINKDVAISINGGTIEQGVFGGGYGTATNATDVTGEVTINMTDGLVTGGIYGGGNVNCFVRKTVSIGIHGGQVGTSDNESNIFGGGLGYRTRVLGSVDVTIGRAGSGDGVVVYGDIYGGSAEGKTNGGSSATANAYTNVTVNAGNVYGSVYGGGFGTSAYEADVYGPVHLTMTGGQVENLFGGNNVNGTPRQTILVDVLGGKTTENVFGGGNLAAYWAPSADKDYPKVTISDGLILGTVFGGGKGDGTMSSTTEYKGEIFGNPHVFFTGGTANTIHGGGNSAPVDGETHVEIHTNMAPNAPSLFHVVENVFGGGLGASAFVTGSTEVGVYGSTTKIGNNVYGGGNAGAILGSTRVIIGEENR